MTVTVVGSYPHISRVRTGLFSLDVALADKKRGQLGLPLRTIAEIYGFPMVGKSSLSYYLAGKVAKKGRVVVCDVENADPDYIQGVFDGSGFDGEVWLIDSTIPHTEVYPLMRMEGRKTIKVGAPRLHEEMLGDLLKALYEKDTNAVIIDSVGAVQSNAEIEGELGQAFMGKPARLMSQVSKKLSGILRVKEDPACVFAINHAVGIMGGGKGHTTPGGDKLKFMAAVRIMLWKGETYRLKDDDPNSILGYGVGGQVEKLRYGGGGRQFAFYIVPGYGVHPGVSAMLDCFAYGLAERGATVKINGKSVGYLKKDLLAYAAAGKTRKFEPFQELIAEHENELIKEDAYDDQSEHVPSEVEGVPGGSDTLHPETDDGEGTEGSTGEPQEPARGRTTRNRRVRK